MLLFVPGDSSHVAITYPIAASADIRGMPIMDGEKPGNHLRSKKSLSSSSTYLSLRLRPRHAFFLCNSRSAIAWLIPVVADSG